MTKALRNVTIEELAAYCLSANCFDCPFNYGIDDQMAENCLGSHLNVLDLNQRIWVPDDTQYDEK